MRAMNHVDNLQPALDHLAQAHQGAVTPADVLDSVLRWQLLLSKSSTESVAPLVGYSLEALAIITNLDPEAEVSIILKPLAYFTLPWWNPDCLIPEPYRYWGWQAALQLENALERWPESVHDLAEASWLAGAHALYMADDLAAVRWFAQGYRLASAGNSLYFQGLTLEGLGRTLVLLRPKQCNRGLQLLSKARKLYAEVYDDYDTAALNRFLASTLGRVPKPTFER